MIARVFPIAIGAIYLFLCVITGLIMPLALFRFIGVPLAAFVLVTVGRVLFSQKVDPMKYIGLRPSLLNKKRLKKEKVFAQPPYGQCCGHRHGMYVPCALFRGLQCL